MPYYRLIKETETKIYVSPKGMEIPGAECVRIDPTSFAEFTDNMRNGMNHIVAFEDERTIVCYLAHTTPTEYILEKCFINSSKKPTPKST